MMATEKQHAAIAEDRFITLREGCRRLGISVRTAHRMRNNDGFPPIFPIGKRLKFRASDIASYIENGGHVDAK